MWNMLGGVRNPWGAMMLPTRPLPSGPVRSATPCMYLGASVMAGSRHVALAADFSSFLMSRQAQAALAQWNTGLLLRRNDAIDRQAKQYTFVEAFAEVANGANDLTAAELYGADETPANMGDYDRVESLFANTLSTIESPPVTPSNVVAIVRRALSLG